MTHRIFGGWIATLIAALTVGCSNFPSHDSAQVRTSSASSDEDPTIETPTENATRKGQDMTNTDAQSDGHLQTATFGSGCFWCTEAVYQRLAGVESVTSGYSGGHVENPTYEQVCEKNTGHAEVIQITYDPSVVSFKELLEVFWKTHDPTTLNQQGGDKGPQYRSAIFYHDDEQRELAQAYKQKLDASKAFGAPIVTEITEFEKFYPAEDYHQDYYNLNPRQGYCAYVIGPKLEKFKEAFADKLKDSE